MKLLYCYIISANFGHKNYHPMPCFLATRSHDIWMFLKSGLWQSKLLCIHICLRVFFCLSGSSSVFKCCTVQAELEKSVHNLHYTGCSLLTSKLFNPLQKANRHSNVPYKLAHMSQLVGCHVVRRRDFQINQVPFFVDFVACFRRTVEKKSLSKENMSRINLKHDCIITWLQIRRQFLKFAHMMGEPQQRVPC